MSDNSQQQGGVLDAAAKAAGVVGGHAQLASGAAKEQIGNMTGAEDWKQAGQDTKQEAGNNIKESFNEFQNATGDSNAGNKASELADKGAWRRKMSIDRMNPLLTFVYSLYQQHALKPAMVSATRARIKVVPSCHSVSLIL